jgi:L-alanine-DL-glutamate epimerase-like enolase superfamily enzyme
VVAAIDRYLAPALRGCDPFDLDGAHRVMDREIASSFSKGAPIAKAGIDLALHDLRGRALGVNIARLWGRAPGKDIVLSWTLNPKSLDDLEVLIAAGRAKGYRHFNVKVAPDPVFDLELCRRTKKLAPDAFLWADANGGYEPAIALETAPKLASAGVAVLEQPVASNRLSAWRDLKRQGALPIIMDEGVVSPADLMEFIRLDLLDGVAMKPARCGGLEPARRQIEILHDAGLLFLGSGLTDPDVSLAASLILFGAFGLAHPAALNGPQFLTESILKSPLEGRDGTMAVPQAPGLGIDVDEARLREWVTRAGAAEPPK